MSQQLDAPAWLGGLLASIGLGWIATTSKKVNEHETAIAVLRKGQEDILRSLDRIEDRLDTKPKQEG